MRRHQYRRHRRAGPTRLCWSHAHRRTTPVPAARQAAAADFAAAGDGRLHCHGAGGLALGTGGPGRAAMAGVSAGHLRGRHGGGAGRLVCGLGAVSPYSAAAGGAAHGHHPAQQGPHRAQPGHFRARQVSRCAFAGGADRAQQPGPGVGRLADGCRQQPAAWQAGGAAGAGRAGDGAGPAGREVSDPVAQGRDAACGPVACGRFAAVGADGGRASPGGARRCAGAHQPRAASGADACDDRADHRGLAQARASDQGKNAAHGLAQRQGRQRDCRRSRQPAAGRGPEPRPPSARGFRQLHTAPDRRPAARPGLRRACGKAAQLSAA